MVPLAALWLPILISAVIVFVASSILHMVLPYHRSDYKKLPEEEKVMAALRSAGVQPGLHMFPFCDHKEMNTPAAQERFKQGPVGHLTIIPSGPPAMPKYLGLWFIYCLLVSFFVAYLAGVVLPSGTHYLIVFRVVGTAAFLSFGLANFANSIWKGQPWSNSIKEIMDGLVYSLLIAGTFGWLWPK